MKGEQVKCLQQKLNITADGKFGKNTKSSVITFQTSNKLKGDGIVGKLTREILNKKEVKLPCTQGELFNTITGASCTPPAIITPYTRTFKGGSHITTYSLSYTAGTGGSITGTASQRINSGNDGTAVTATPDAGYVFDTWSDGVLTATRTDNNITANKSVTATFLATISATAIVGITAPVTGATPTATISDTSEYTAIISWNTNPVTFASNTIYTATITITPKTGYTLTGVPANFFTVAGATTTNSADTGVVSAVFPVTDTTINTAAIAGVTAPAKNAVPTATIADTAQYTATISWSPTDNPFLGTTVYTATITITPKTGYTLVGVSQNFFTVAGATATNTANTGVVTAVFPATYSVAIGDSYQGGKVAYFLQSGDPGYVAGEMHGLIAADADQSTGVTWDSGAGTMSGSNVGIQTTLGTGLANTDKTIIFQGMSYASGVARAYTDGIYADWFLPSYDELNKLYINRVLIGGFASASYWSSSAVPAVVARYQNFSTGSRSSAHVLNPFRVRAIRSF